MNTLKRISKKISFTTILFFLISIVSLTFAWFAYVSSAKANMELEVLAWHIEFDDDTTTINLEVEDVFPGMDDYYHEVSVTNDGDIDAQLSYKIKKIRAFDEEYTMDDEYAMQTAFASFPFHINISTTNSTVEVGHTEKFVFEVTWEYETGNDALDTYWGEMAYQFRESEQAKKELDPSYEIKKALDVEIELIAQQGFPITFTISGNTYDALDGDTWGDWIKKTGTPIENATLMLSSGCGKSDAEISTLAAPFNQDTRTNDLYCSIYLQSSRVGGGNPTSKLISQDGDVQKNSDLINNGESYSGSS